jgi:xanthine dehydrogenase accessory factor
MDSIDLSVLKALQEWRSAEQALWLVTVVETFGSSPRPQGAMLALRGDGLAVGSVSGGCTRTTSCCGHSAASCPVHAASC